MKRLAILLVLLAATSAWGATGVLPVKFTPGDPTADVDSVRGYIFYPSGYVIDVDMTENTDSGAVRYWEGLATVTLDSVLHTIFKVWYDNHTDSAQYAGDPILMPNPASYKAGAGSGAEPCTLIVIDAVGAAIQGAKVRFKSSDGSTSVATSQTGTDVTGQEVFSLNAATYTVYVALLGYNQDTIPQTMAFGVGGGFDTLTMTVISNTLSDSAGLCRVYGWLQNHHGTRIKNAVVSFTPTNTRLVRGGDVLYMGTTYSKPTDANGKYEVYVVATPNLIPDTTGTGLFDSTFYNINASYIGAKEAIHMTLGTDVSIPDSASLNLSRWLVE